MMLKQIRYFIPRRLDVMVDSPLPTEQGQLDLPVESILLQIIDKVYKKEVLGSGDVGTFEDQGAAS